MSFENIGESGSKNGHKNPKAGVDQKHSNGKEINILVLGMPGVGKTALTVRFLTKRFIGDYNSEVEMLYSHSMSVDSKHVTLHIIDSLGQKRYSELSQDQIIWADCFVVVYAINNKDSFDAARRIIEYIHKVRDDSQAPVGLVANKSDLIDRKQVSDTDVSRLCAEYSLYFFETSASESHYSVSEVFLTLCRQVRQIMKKREKLTRFMSNPAVAAKLQIQQSLKNLAERTWRARTSTL